LKKSHLILIILVSLVSIIFYETVISLANSGFRTAPLDDTYIHLKFADNFSKGYFFRYNPDEPTAGSTSPLWVILVGFSGLVNDGLLFNAIFFSWLFYIFSAFLIYKIIYFLTAESKNFLALFASLFFLLTGRVAYISSSGMETSLFIFLLLTVIYIDLTHKEPFSPIKWLMCGLLVNTRPEGFLLAFLLLLKDILCIYRNRSHKKHFQKMMISLSIFLLLSAPYIIFSYYTNGSPFPNTFKGVNKLYTENQNLVFLKKNIVFFLRDNIFVFFMALCGILFLIKKFYKEKNFSTVYLPLFYFLIHLGFSVFFFPNARHYGRYFIPDFALLIIIGVYFAQVIFSKRNIKFKVQNRLIIIILIFSLPYFIKIAFDNSKFVSNINSMHIEAVKWINSNIPKNSIIGLNDVGAIGYYTNNYIIDLEGLITPGILKYKDLENSTKNDSIFTYLYRENANYLILFDNWYPGLTKKYKNNLRFIHTILVENNLTLGDDNLDFYEIIREN